MNPEPVNTPSAGRFELPLPDSTPSPADRPTSLFADSIDPFLLSNVRWYCRLRWAVAAFFLLFGAFSRSEALMQFFGLRTNLQWPFVLAGVLILANLAFLAHLRRPRPAAGESPLRLNLWGQIIFDLATVTVTVHLSGSVETNVAFIYLFHIVLSCIFLSRMESFAVTLAACGLYAACIGIESIGLLPGSTVYASMGLRDAVRVRAEFPLVQAGSVGLILVVAWFLTSRLASMLHRRDSDLLETNRRLLQTQREKMRFMLQTTHELKAPFAAIQANTQLLLKGFCGPLTPESENVITRINARSHRLAGMIHEMLQLANLRSESEGPLKFSTLNLKEILTASVEQVRQVADEHGIRLMEETAPARAAGIEEHLKVLFINLIKNAVQYSHVNGLVQIRCESGLGANGATVTITDQGIGIPADKLPKIFDEYFRTNEATQFNKDSTGLGLAIVRHIAGTHHIRVEVESTHGKGTLFRLRFPSVPSP